MADDTSDDSAETETGDDTETGEEGEGKGKKAATSATPRVGLQSLLTRDSDMTVRPGFRNPANKRTKAQKKKRKKK